MSFDISKRNRKEGGNLLLLIDISVLRLDVLREGGMFCGLKFLLERREKCQRLRPRLASKEEACERTPNLQVDISFETPFIVVDEGTEGLAS